MASKKTLTTLKDKSIDELRNRERDPLLGLDRQRAAPQLTAHARVGAKRSRRTGESAFRHGSVPTTPRSRRCARTCGRSKRLTPDCVFRVD